MCFDELIGHSPDIYFTVWSDSMAAQHNKRPHVAEFPDAESSTDPDQKIKKLKRRVSIATFDKWKRQFDDQYQTLRWLQCDKDTTDYTVTVLWCEVCRKYSDQIRTMRNFSSAWVNGSANQRNSNIVDHAKSEQHAAAMARMRADAGEPPDEEKVVFVVENAAFLASFPVMDGKETEKMKRKFQICYMMAREGLPFNKYVPLHNLQELHGVDLGPSYKTNNSAQVFTNYIAKSQRRSFQSIFVEKHFFSFMFHRSTSAASKGSAIVLLHCLMKNDLTKEINCCCRYLNVVNLTNKYESEMTTCLGVSLGRLGVNVLSKDGTLNAMTQPTLVGGSSDRANDEDDQSMKAEMQSTFPWLFWSWSFAHQLELACKSSFTSSLYEEMNDLLIHLYSLCNKSPQKTHQLLPIVEDLKEVFYFPETEDPVPVHNQGTRWVNHKRKVLQRIVDRFGVYCTHLHSMTNDPSLEATDQAKLKSFHQRWAQGKFLVGCAMYIDVLKAPSLLSLSLQDSETDLISGIKLILKATQTLHSLKETNVQEWPAIMTILAAITEKGNSKSYQSVILADLTNTMISQYSAMAQADLRALDGKLKDWLVWSDTKLLDSILSFLDTRCWTTLTVNTTSSIINDNTAVNGGHCNGETTAKCKSDYNKKVTEIKSAVAYIVGIFREPLEAKGADLCSINDELEEMFSFCTNYVDVLAEDYKKIWYKLFSAHDSQKWCNVLLISELLFSLPFANSKVEQALLTLNLIKTECHPALTDTVLNDLMEIKVEGLPTNCFDANNAVQLWWTNCAQKPIEDSNNCNQNNSSDSNNSTDLSLSDWDEGTSEAVDKQ